MNHIFQTDNIWRHWTDVIRKIYKINEKRHSINNNKNADVTHEQSALLTIRTNRYILVFVR